ncbi:autotransporter outer membrane beta-barrel domain-containing protein [Agarilytica rhodophyticola]|uniref:autotransporter outer membrane beta-barrel domain-containing protein n=1 Tax=Agarilytica rhodophyticola TaxID=1737490 RepID=UPI000B343F6B|nr:autotransporter outer membrane beta-barrel domain-containing protein [Agarilytica rhodophyticola]
MRPKGITPYLASSALILGIITTPTHANIQQLIDQNLFNDLEREAASAALITYNRLISDGGCSDSQRIGTGTCSGQTFELFDNVRELIHTANEITGAGPTAFSLGADIEGLGFSLRWTAAEEYAAQGNLSSEFVGGQVSGLAARLTALRAGASGFNIIGIGSTWQQNNNGALASAYGNRGAGASSDGNAYSPWGGFLNVDFGSGSREPTNREDAFDFENFQFTLGMDYRINNNWIAGLVLGNSIQEIDFDSALSIVEGKIEADGVSIMPFVMYQKDAWYVSASLGWQQISFDSERAIRYPSFNLDLESINTLAVSDTDANVTSLFVEAGYTWFWKKFAVEPFANITYSDTSVDGFIEDDVNNDAFDLVIESQDITSQEFTFGTKFQYTLTPSFGVFVPYITLELITQNDDASRNIRAYYAQDTTGTTAFSVPTEELDSSYYSYTVGMSSVIRGGRQRQAGGAVGGDIQGFISYKSLEGLEGFDIDLYSLGLRYTF